MKQLFVSLCLFAMSYGAVAQVAAPEKESFEFDGKTRTYKMYEPENITAGGPRGGFVHGYG